ncbi:MAG TPA: flagellar filament capping protein FliD [Acidobacteriaceae bacterium]|nr:flagellar filament capping protein FliD [Acidobacteriaceae bacterium]
MSSISALNSLLGSSSSSNSAINLSQILEAALGASSEGIDVNSAVSAALSAAEQPETQWESQYSTLQNQVSALNAIQSDANTLDTDMQSLNNLMGPLSATTVASSNSSIVTGTAVSGTASGNHVVEVSSLATTASWASDIIATASTPLAAGSFTITGANGTVTTISTGSGSSTLNDVASTINGDNLGVTATVVTDATGARLAIVSNTSGSAANFSVSAPTGGSLSFSQTATGANASLTVDGLQISSASNDVTGVVPGLTLNLQSASLNTPVSLSISPDTSQASTAINQFVTDYNTLINAVNAQFADSGSGEGVLATDPTVRNLQSELLQVLDYTYVPSYGTTGVPNLSSLGITVNKDGTLNVDAATLSNALNNNFSDVQTFFQGTALNGFANELDQQLTNFTSPADGAFTVDLQSMSTQESTLQTDVTNFQTNVIAPLQTQLQSEYSQAEIALQQLPTQMKEIDEELGMNNSSNG